MVFRNCDFPSNIMISKDAMAHISRSLQGFDYLCVGARFVAMKSFAK